MSNRTRYRSLLPPSVARSSSGKQPGSRLLPPYWVRIPIRSASFTTPISCSSDAASARPSCAWAYGRRFGPSRPLYDGRRSKTLRIHRLDVRRRVVERLELRLGGAPEVRRRVHGVFVEFGNHVLAERLDQLERVVVAQRAGHSEADLVDARRLVDAQLPDHFFGVAAQHQAALDHGLDGLG